MKREEHLLVILGEEAAEVIHRASKVLRFGEREIEPGDSRENASRLLGELDDLYTVADMLYFAGVLHRRPCFMEAKQKKVERFLELSREQGTLDAA